MINVYICAMKDRKQTLGFLLARSYYAIATSLNGLLRREEIDLSHSQYVLLKVLYEKDGLSQQELAAKVYKNAAAVKRTLDILENKGLVERIPVSLRKNSIKITPEGRVLIYKVIESIRKWDSEILSGVSDEEYKIFEKTLNTIFDNTQ